MEGAYITALPLPHPYASVHLPPSQFPVKNLVPTLYTPTVFGPTGIASTFTFSNLHHILRADGLKGEILTSTTV